MYSDTNRKNATRRANDDFLRRMLGGELTGDGYPVMNVNTSAKPPAEAVRRPSNNGGVLCDGTPRDNTSGCANKDCPSALQAPSIAMVYSPRQCWRNLFDPATGLSHGTIFQELVLPLEVVSSPHHNKEVKTRRPL